MTAEHVSFWKDKPVIDLELIGHMKELIPYCEMSDSGGDCYGQLEACHVRARGMGGGRRKDLPENIFIACTKHHREFDGHGQSMARQRWATENIIRTRPVWLQQTLQEYADRER